MVAAEVYGALEEVFWFEIGVDGISVTLVLDSFSEAVAVDVG